MGSNEALGAHRIGGASLLACAIALPALGDALYVNATGVAGIDAVHQSMVSSMFCGGCVGDFDGDGWQDVFWPAGGHQPDRLYMNNGDGTFTNRAAEWGIAVTQRSTGGAPADYDGDGDLDLFVSCMGPVAQSLPGHHCLYRNDGGFFTQVAAQAGVAWTATTHAEGTSAAWGDYDLDGDLDLAVAGYGWGPGLPSTDGNRLFRNEGDGTFTDVTASSGIGASFPGLFGFGPRFCDMNGDRYPELIWIGDFGSSLYFRNNGDGTFTDRTGPSGTSLGDSEMGFTVADFDGNGTFDFYVTTIENNRLYLNTANGVFQDVGAQLNVDDTGIGWGAVAVDLDHDTYPDIVAACMNDQRQYAFVNQKLSPADPLSFLERATSLGIVTPVSGRGLANFDYDNDGDQDLLFFPGNGPVTLFRSRLDEQPTNWIRIFLDRGDRADVAPQGIGSVVAATFGARTLLGRIDGGTNYLSQSEASAHFGLGGATLLNQLQVRWTNGEVTTFENVPVNRTVTLIPGGRAADVNLNTIVEFGDLLRVIAGWGPCRGCREDIDGNGMVGFTDLIAVLTAWE